MVWSFASKTFVKSCSVQMEAMVLALSCCLHVKSIVTGCKIPRITEDTETALFLHSFETCFLVPTGFVSLAPTEYEQKGGISPLSSRTRVFILSSRWTIPAVQSGHGIKENVRFNILPQTERELKIRSANSWKKVSAIGQ